MCSRFRTLELMLLCAALAGCNSKHNATTVAEAPPNTTAVQGSPMPAILPGHGTPPPEDAIAARYENDDKAKAEGARLYDWYNCAGCHFHGAGGIGPSLMDNDWIYGGSMEQIYASIFQGRPNGMPSWGRKLSSTEIWEIAAYVHSLPSTNPAGAASLPNPPLPPVRPDDARTSNAPEPAAK